ncbi:hypothetical protein BRC85_00200 [Halobacteriales archaeon QS_1_69_70]|nr:MAG: hypothetical protein BRC85_00200 [Halobacteriales archaeon QS_1_69_70]
MSGSAPGRREVAYRVFAAEFDDATVAYSESDEERAPNYVVTPTGARANRLFAVGVLTAVEDVNPEMVRGRVVDPTGPFVTYAGQYQPDALAFLERAEPPTFVALTGKARTFEPDDGDAVYSSVRPESVNAVDADTRDRWVVTAAERTLTRIGVVAAALEAEPTGDRLRAALEEAGVDERLADGVALAVEHYGTTPAYLDALRETALDAVRVVAGERDEAGQLDVQPAAAGGPAAADLASVDLSGLPTTPVEAASTDADVGGPATSADAASMDAAETEEQEKAASAADTEADTGPGAVDTGEPGDADAAPDADAAAEADVDAERETAAAPDVDAEAADAPDADADPADTEPADTGTGPGDFEGGEFDLDEETRQDVEEEYGTEFSTADEVESADDAAGAAADDTAAAEPDAVAESDVDAGDPDDVAGEASDDAAAGDAAPASAATEGAATGGAGEVTPEDAADETTAEDAADESMTEAPADGAAAEGDLEDAVMAAMETVGDGEGTDRAALVDAVVEAEGVDRDEVEAAIEDALMSGRCYEPDEGTLKAI